MAAGSIVVDLLMRTGTFETDTARAGKSLKKLQKDAEAVGRAIGVAFVGAVAGLGVLVKNSIDSADHLNDLSKSTGVAVETLGGIGFAASQAGSSLDGAAKAIGKLNQTLAKAASGNKEAGAALRALGVQAIDPLTGKTTTVDKALVQLARTFEKAGDSPEKFRAAAGALGKQYQELIPLLSDGGDALLANISYYQRYGGITTETAKRADEFNDTLGKINLLTGAFGRTLAAELLIPLQGIAGAFLASKEKGDGFKSTAVGIKDAIVGIATAAAFVVESLSAMSSRLDGIIQKSQALSAASKSGFGGSIMDPFGTSKKGFFGSLIDPVGSANLPRGDLAKQFRVIDDQVAADVAAAQKRYDDFVKRLREGSSLPGSPKKGGGIPGIPDASVLAAAETALKKRLDGLLHQIKSATDQQQDALAFHNKLLEGEYQDGIISLTNFYEDQKSIRQRALQVQLEEQDKIIEAEEAFKKRTSNAGSRLDSQNKIDQAREAKTRLTVKASQEEQLALKQNARDAIALQQAFDGVNAQVLDLRENFAAAAAVKFDLQFFELTKTFTKNSNTEGLAFVENLRAAAIAQAAFQKASLDIGRTLGALTNAEERLAIAQETGAITSLEMLSRVGSARRAQIPILEAQVAAEEAIAKASGNANLIINAEAARLALDKLKASIDPLADVLNKTLGGAFEDAFVDFVMGTKSAGDAFKSFANTVIAEITRMAAKDLAKSIFGSAGTSSGWLSVLQGLFGSGSSATPGVGSSAGYGTASGYPMATGTNQIRRDGNYFLHKDEAVVPKAYNPALGGGGNTYVTVENHGAQIQEERSQRGNDQLVKIIVKAAADEVDRRISSGGSTAKTISGTYGLSRATGAPKRA